MKIILCNKYFFLNGGTERYLSRCLEAIPERGHEAIPFSVKYAGSWQSEYSEYFLTPPGDAKESHYSKINLTPRNAAVLAARSIYSIEGRKKLAKLLDHVGGADIGYILNVYNYMSPSIIHSFRKRKIPTVVRFGDYHPLCANYNFLRDNKPCTLCCKGSYYYGLKYKCVKNNLAASAVRVVSMYVQRLLNLYRGCDAFIAPCSFMRQKLIEGGFPAERIHIIRQAAPKFEPRAEVSKGNYIIFFGRVSPEKGLDTLIRAYQRLAPSQELLIIGRSYDNHVNYLKSLVQPEFLNRINFLDFLDGDALNDRVEKAMLTVVPSRWYDNAPLATYESYLLGTPVLAANIGGIPEQIRAGETGELFSPDDENDLTERLRSLLANPIKLEAMGREAKRYATEELTMDAHLDQLLDLFNALRGAS